MKQIEIDGVKYNINLDKAIEQGLITPVPLPKKTGQHFQNKVSGNYYVLADGFEQYVSLINMKTGDYFRQPIQVRCSASITEGEWQRITGHDHYNFIYVKDSMTIYPL